MFHIYADNKPIYNPLDESLILYSPQLILEMGKAGSLQFNIPSTHQFYGQLQQLKTIVTVELDDVEIFRGRVLSNNRSFNNMRTIYCEGDLAYLVDSVQKGEKYEGTTHDLFRKIIRAHNDRVDSSKRFTVGTIGIENRSIVLAGQSDEIEDLETGSFDYNQIAINSIVDDWKTSYDYIDSCLIDYCGGYLRTRRNGNTTYIDLVTDYGHTAVQQIEFGVNMLDLTEEISAEEVFTVLIPLGDDNLTIAEVNNGSDELVDESAVARYGRIVKTHVFDNVNKASTLLENGRRYLESNVNLPITITVKAVDMHLVEPDAKEIYIGDKVCVNSLRHDLVDYLTCTRIEYDLANPANNTYTFGNPRQTLTERYRKDKIASSDSSSRNSGKGGASGGTAAAEEAQEILDKFYDAWINVDPSAAHIDLGTLYKEFQDGKETLESFCGISLDAPAGNINIKTLRKEFDELGTLVKEQNAYIDILNNEQGAQIALVAEQVQTLEDLESKHHAEILLFADDTKASIDLIAEHQLVTDEQISNSSATIAMLADDLQAQITLQTEHNRWTENEIVSSKAQIDILSDDLKAQIISDTEYRKEINGKISTSNTKITQLSNELSAQIKLETEHIKELNGKITTSSTNITQLSTELSALITLEAAHKKELDGQIKSSNTSIKQIANDLSAQITLEATHYEKTKDKISTSNAKITEVSDNLKAQIKLEAAHKKELDGQIKSSNTTINQVASDLKAQITLEAKHKTEVDGKITNTNARIKEVANDLEAQITLEAKHNTKLTNSIASITVTANELESSIKLKADKTTLESKVTSINSDIIEINGRIKSLQADVAQIDSLVSKRINAYFTDTVSLRAGSITVAKDGNIKGTLMVNNVLVSNNLYVNNNTVATQSWVKNQGYLTSIPSALTVTSVKATDKMTIGVEKVATQYWCMTTKKFATQDWVLEQLKKYALSTHTHAWTSISGKPTSFSPARHRHAINLSIPNGHTHQVTVNGTKYTSTGVSTNATHSISSNTDYYGNL